MHANKLLVRIFTTLLMGMVSLSFAEGVSNDSPVGYWKTMDDATGKPKSIVQIWKTADHKLMGKVIKIYPASRSAKNNKLCTACRGDKHNKPLVGMVILSGLSMQQHSLSNGHILDPENGKTYKCTVRVTEKGKHLNVRDYFGLPLFGRSQTWERVDLMTG